MTENDPQMINQTEIKEEENPTINVTNIPNPQYSLEFFINENKLLRNQINYYQEELSNVKEAHYTLERQNNVLNEERDILSNKLKQFDQFKQLTLITNTTLNEQILRLSQEINNQKESMQRIQIVNNTYEKTIDDYKNQLLSINQHLNERNNDISLHLSSINQLTTAKSELEQKINGLNTEIAFIKMNQAQNEQQLRTQLNLSLQNEEMIKIDKETLEQKYSLLNDSFNKLQMEYVNSKQRNDSLKQDLNKQINMLKEVNKSKESQLEQNELIIKSKQFKIDELNQTLNNMTKGHITMKNESSLLKEMVNDKENEIKKLYEYKRKFDTIDFYDNNKSINKSSSIISIGNYSQGEIELFKDDYQKLKTSYNQLKYEKDNLQSSTKLMTIQLKDYDDLKEQLRKKGIDNNELALLKKEHQIIVDEYKKYKSNTEHFKERFDIISQQNRKLLLRNALDFGHSNSSYLSQSLTNEEYEKFLYNNIEDLESKINQVIESNLLYQKEMNSLKAEIDKSAKELESNNILLKSMKDYTQGLEIVSSSQRKENNQMKQSLSSSFFIWNDNKMIIEPEDKSLLNNQDEQSIESKYQELTMQFNDILKKEKISQEEIQCTKKQLDIEIEKNNTLNNEVITKLNESIQSYQNQIAEIKKEMISVQMQNANFNNQLNEKVSNIKVYENKLEDMNQMITMLQNDKKNLTQTIDLMIKNNSEKTNETKMFIEKNMKDILEENKEMKGLIEHIKESVKDMTIPQGKEHITNSGVGNVNDKDTDVKSMLIQKQKEFMELKLQNSQMKITIENISSENSMLKYQQSIFNKQLSPYIPNASMKSNQSISQSLSQSQNDINITVIEENYLKIVNENKDLYADLMLLKNKCNELTQINNQLISGDITGPYKALSNQIDELTLATVHLQQSNEALIKEKEGIIKNYSHINLTNESLKAKINKLEIINSNLIQEKIALADIIKKSSNEIEQLKQKDIIIYEKSIENEGLNCMITELNNTINRLENEKTELNNHEKNLKEEVELKKKEVFESKSKCFKSFYLFFKNSRNVINLLNKINADLEEQMIEVQNAKSSLNNKIEALELQNVSLESLLAEKDKIIDQTKTELLLTKDLSMEMEKEMKIIQTDFRNSLGTTTPITPHTNEVTTVAKPQVQNTLKMFMFNKLKQAKTLITFLNNRVIQLEKENMNGHSINNSSSTIDALREEIMSHLFTINEKEKIITKLKGELLQATLHEKILSQDINTLSSLFKNSNDQSNPKKPKVEGEKNKAFTQLLFQMRKASKLLTFLTKSVNN